MQRPWTSPWTVTGDEFLGRTDVDPSSRPESASNHRSPSPVNTRPQPSATTQSVLAKVNRAHKALVRKEVWRQKFDFLYRQVEEEFKNDQNNASHSSSANAGGASMGPTASSAASMHGAMSMKIDGTSSMHVGSVRPSGAMGSGLHGSLLAAQSDNRNHGGSHAGSSRPGSAAGGKVTFGRPRSSSGCSNSGLSASASASATGASTSAFFGPAASIQPGGPKFNMQTDKSENSLDKGLPSSAQEGPWRRSSMNFGGGPQARRMQRAAESAAIAAQSSGASKASRAGTPSSGARPNSATAVAAPLPKILATSQSLPGLTVERRSRELTGIRDEYYGGDEQLMNEDILFCSNPHLFPLRQGDGRDFPLHRLVSYHGHHAEGEAAPEVLAY